MYRESSRHPGLFAIVALLALFGLVLTPSFASAQEAVTGIVASGRGEVRVRPDSLRIMVGVESPRGNQSGGKVAAPAFARLASRALGE